MAGPLGMTMRDGVDLVRIVLGMAIAAAIAVAAVVGYRHYTRDYEVTTREDGTATAQVVAATLFGRSELRVGRLSGTVQGVAGASRLWGWLRSTQVVKAPFTVDYFVSLERLDLKDFRYDVDRRVLFVQVPDVRAERANIDLANTTLNEVKGLFVTRGQMAEMMPRVAASAGAAAQERANTPENVRKSREYARGALERLFGGALGAAGLDARIEVRFPFDPVPSGEPSDRTRSLREVLSDPKYAS
jgi:hypothetical protein